MICSNCKKDISASVAFNPLEPEPTPGALSLCFYCGQLAQFQEDLSLLPFDFEKLTTIQQELVGRVREQLMKRKNAPGHNWTD